MCASPVFKARSALAGVQIAATKKSTTTPNTHPSSGGQGVVDSDAKSQLSHLGIRAAESKASNRPPQAPEKIQFIPPPLPGVGGPLGKRRTPQGAREMAQEALRSAQGRQQQNARQHAKEPSDSVKLKASMEAASRALTDAVQKKLSMREALQAHSSEL